MRYSGIGLVSLAILAAGCVQQPHNNVLLFGTDTKVALDVSSSATSGGAPQITLGYRRAEAVWMPLVVNDYTCTGTQSGQCTAQTAYETTSSAGVVTNRKPAEYTGSTTTTTTSADGKTNKVVEERDAYSVFASFGAKFAGEATPTGSEASGGLAQFFATGVAAQRLAQAPSVSSILKVANVDESKAIEAEANARAAEANLTAAELQRVDAFLASDGAKLAAVRGCLIESDDSRNRLIAALPDETKINNEKFAAAELQRITDSTSFQRWWLTLTEAEKDTALTACGASVV